MTMAGALDLNICEFLCPFFSVIYLFILICRKIYKTIFVKDIFIIISSQRENRKLLKL